MKRESLEETIRRVLLEGEKEAKTEAPKPEAEDATPASVQKIAAFLAGEMPKGFNTKAVGLAVLAANVLATQQAQGKEWGLREQMLATGIDDMLKGSAGLTNNDISEQIIMLDVFIDHPLHIVIF